MGVRGHLVEDGEAGTRDAQADGPESLLRLVHIGPQS
jgi:hypothetical protein